MLLLSRSVLSLEEKQSSEFLEVPTVSLSLYKRHIEFNTASLQGADSLVSTNIRDMQVADYLWVCL